MKQRRDARLPVATFALAVKEELCGVRLPEPRHGSAAPGTAAAVEAELHGLIRGAGTLVVSRPPSDPARSRPAESRAAPGLTCEVRADRAVVARRAYRLFRAAAGVRPVLAVRRGPGPAGGRFVCRLAPAAPALGALGLLDREGRPLPRIPSGLLRPGRAPALLRGFFLGAGSVDDPARDHHLEFVVAEDAPAVADDLRAALAGLGCPARRSGRRGRIVVYLKDGAAIASLLGAMGAAQAMLRYEEQRVRRDVRGRVNRLVNAETANIGKAALAGLRQREDVQALAASGALERLPADLQAVARARLGHPEASLREIGELCDPPLGKSAVQRRMAALRRMVRAGRPGGPAARAPSSTGAQAGGALHCARR